MLFIGTFRQ